MHPPTFQLIGLNCRYTHSCLALYYVRHALEHHLQGCRVGIHQLTINDPYYDLLIKVGNLKADALFISVYVWNAQYVARLVADLAEVEPRRPVILGGPQATALENLPETCTTVEGEIEGVAEQFFNDLEDNNLLPTYQASAGNSFPFPYNNEDFKTSLKDRQVYYESSRGCPFRCSYCLSSVGQKMARKDIEAIKDELSSIIGHKPKIIKFVDRTFNNDPARALEIWHYLADLPGNTRFHFEIAPDRFTKEMFDFLATIGPDRFQFEIGIQSTNSETLKAINRTMDVGVATENVSRLVKLNSIHLHVDLILGLPYDTRETFLAAFDTVFAMEPHYIQMGLLKILPDTPIRQQVPEHGTVHCRQPPYEILANRWLDHPEMNRLYLYCECVEAFYNNRYFRSLWKYLTTQGEKPSSFFAALLLICEQHQFFDLAHTQELLARMLCMVFRDRPDRDLMMNIMRYDWLRCGHRFLPPFLEEKSLAEIRKTLRQVLPQSIPGVFDPVGRSEFIKRGVFMVLSPDVLHLSSLSESNTPEIVCFLPEQTSGVLKHNQAVCLEGIL